MRDHILGFGYRVKKPFHTAKNIFGTVGGTVVAFYLYSLCSVMTLFINHGSRLARSRDARTAQQLWRKDSVAYFRHNDPIFHLNGRHRLRTPGWTMLTQNFETKLLSNNDYIVSVYL